VAGWLRSVPSMSRIGEMVAGFDFAKSVEMESGLNCH